MWKGDESYGCNVVDKSVSSPRRIFVLETESMEKVRLPRRSFLMEEGAPLIVERVCLRSDRCQNGSDDEATAI
jgi:hypothetical protein